MQNFTKRFLITLWLVLGAVSLLWAQTTVSGTVKDKESGETLVGVNIIVKGKVVGTTTDATGKFSLSTDTPTPFTLQFSVIGYGSQEVEVTASGQEINLEMSEELTFGQEIVVSASRVEESIMESPVTVEKMDIIAIRQASSHDFYDGISKMKGVHTSQGSLTLTSVNTRGFATIANTRFVQLMDGMDNAAPLLNFPTGNVVGMSELDMESVELVPGAASALYGPNAFNGILFMNSKNPFEYQGLSVQVKGGATNSDANGSNPYLNTSIRYAKAFNDKFAFKVNFSYMDAEDWYANDYLTDRNMPGQLQEGDPTFDGLNMYGDESAITVPFAALVEPLTAALAPAFAAQLGVDEATAAALLGPAIPQLGILATRRTGWREEDLLESQDAKSMKADAGLYYRVNDDLELSYNFRWGSGSTVYQGAERYALRDFTQMFNKIELKSSNYFLRAYSSFTDDGDSYNLTALGAFANEGISPTASEWVPNYAGVYAGALLPTILQGGQPTASDIALAHGVARAAADATRPAVGSAAANAIIEQVRSNNFGSGGAGFIDDSKLYHIEGNYNFGHLTDAVEIQIGGNWRLYNLSTEGTVFNEDPDGDGNFERIKINEYGFYTQLSKKLAQERLKLTGSIRFDKNENFDGQFTHRLSMVYSAGDARQHNFRASFQTGFRNPDTQAQFIYFPTTSILLGGTEANAARYGIHNGGAYTNDSYQAFLATALAGAPDPTVLEVIDFDYVQPERLTAFEVGYKGIIANKLLLDLNVYHNRYKDFLTQITVVNIEPTEHRGQPLPTGTAFRPYVNVPDEFSSTGFGLGLTYKFPKGYVFTGNYSYADFSLDQDNEFEPGFNTPQSRFNIQLANREFVKNAGFSLSYRWQDEFFWQNGFGESQIPAFGVFDAQVSYKIKSLKSVVKLGGSNLLGDQYRTNTGGPFVGSMYYLSLTFDQFMN